MCKVDDSADRVIKERQVEHEGALFSLRLDSNKPAQKIPQDPQKESLRMRGHNQQAVIVQRGIC
jgi:hypothetical protein